MFCTKCGTRLDESARFCTSCGAATTLNAAPPVAKLRRLLNSKKIAGVCAGYAEYFDMDLTLMRLIWVGLTVIPPHLGAIAYVVSGFVLPAE